MMDISSLKLNEIDLNNIKEDISEKNRINGSVRENDEGVAIIGMDGRVGNSESLEQLWEFLISGQEGVTSFPNGRIKDLEPFLSRKGLATSVTTDSFLRCLFMPDISQFDYQFFGMSKQEAIYMDPNQRILLETAWKALEDAGYCGQDIKGTNTGVYVGYSSDFGEDYRHLVNTVSPNAPDVAISGNVRSAIASRIAYHLDLHGPATVIDTACSSGLMAMYTAFRAIRNGECEMAIVGSVNTDLIPLKDDGESGLGIKDVHDINSDNGRTKTFDNSCDGTVAAEGAFAFVLKSLKLAKRDGDTIRAVILGGAANQDGTSMGITAPNSKAQEELLISALNDAGLSGEDLSYIEAHGTATKLGDPIEVRGIDGALKRFTNKRQFCAIGSIKSNIGHLDNAAGLGGIAKVVLAMENRIIPANSNFSIPNQNIDFIDSPVYINDQNAPWSYQSSETLYAGISSFGLSGTNCHLILHSPSQPKKIRTGELPEEEQLFVYSAKSLKALRELSSLYAQYLQDKNVDLKDAAYTIAKGRMQHNLRVAICFKTREQLCRRLMRFSAFAKDAVDNQTIFYGKHRITEKNKRRYQEGEITESERRELELEAFSLISESDGPLNNKKLYQLARLYTAGATLPVALFSRNKDVKTIPMPTYPFQREKCWVEAISTNVNKDTHPLLAAKHFSTLNQSIYRKTFTVSKYWELSEHKILGNSILPGTAFIEMMVEYLRKSNGTEMTVSLQDILFHQPFLVEDEENKELHLLVELIDDRERFRFASLDENGEWVTHAEAYSTSIESKKTVEALNLDEISQNLQVEIPPIQYKSEEAKGIELGEHWNTLVLKSRADEDMSTFLFEIELLHQFHREVQLYNFHPALMDNAVNSCNHLLDEGQLYLPLSYGNLHLYRKIPANIVVYVKKHVNKKETSVHRFEIVICDHAGNIIADIKDYCIKSVPKDWSEKDYGYVEALQEYTLPLKKDLPKGKILFVGRNSLTTKQVINQLENKGRVVSKILVAENGHSWEKALEQLRKENQFEMVIFQWESKKELNTAQQWQVENSELIVQSTKFIKAFVQSKLRTNGMMILTNSTDSETGLINPMQVALSGLFRICALEMNSLNIRCIDYDRNTNIDLLLNEFANDNRPSHVFYRNNQVYTPIMKASRLPKDNHTSLTFDEGVYVISGGTGDLGMELADFLVKKRVQKLVLLGKSKIPERKEWESLIQSTSENAYLKRRIKRWIALEKRVEFLQLRSINMEDYDEVNAVLNEVRKEQGNIRGIFHLAGNAGDGFLLNKDNENFNQVYFPKSQGAINLHFSTLEDNLSYFVLFSSISSLELSPGQTDYTAANMFLDSFAKWRKQKGLPAISIQWPAWIETGMAHRYGATNESELYEPLKTKEALDLIEILLSNYDNLPSVIMPGKRKNRKNTDKKLIDNHNAPMETMKVSLLNVSSPDETHMTVGMIWAKTLAIEEIDVDEEFSALGGNSLLTTQMLTLYEQKYPGTMDIADLFTYTTIREQAKYIQSQIDQKEQTSNNKVSNYEHASQQEEFDLDADIDDLLEQVSRGEISVEESSKKI